MAIVLSWIVENFYWNITQIQKENTQITAVRLDFL